MPNKIDFRFPFSDIGLYLCPRISLTLLKILFSRFKSMSTTFMNLSLISLFLFRNCDDTLLESLSKYNYSNWKQMTEYKALYKYLLVFSLSFFLTLQIFEKWPHVSKSLVVDFLKGFRIHWQREISKLMFTRRIRLWETMQRRQDKGANKLNKKI